MMMFSRSLLVKSTGQAAAAVVTAVLLSIAVATVPARGQSEVRVLVNDDPITSYDISTRAQMLRVFSRGTQGDKEAVEQLIDERLMLQEAARLRMVVSDAEVDEEFADRAKKAGTTPEVFGQAMRQAGVDPETFRDFLRANKAWSQIVRARFRATVDITELDVATALAKRDVNPEQQVASYEYMLQQILFIVPAKASAATEAQQRNAASAFRDSFMGCDQSLAQVGGTPGVVVRPTVRREEPQMPAGLKERLTKLNIGDIDGPERVDDGYQLVAICAKKEIPGQTVASEEVREELTSEKGQLMARRYLRDLRSDAVIDYR
ncbi:MAG TPA: peptidylprolyl isomerase [Propylenella sp.]|nr:peptidylprolyl isomerase [Propylenella sp.]